MTARDRDTLKGYFNTGDVPTEANFADKVDSFYHRDDLGWADYADTQYTELSPLTVPANTPIILPNNGANGPKSFAPANVPALYNIGTQRISGVNGDSRLITVEFNIKPTSVATTLAEVWFDIGGSVGELYRRFISFPKGTNQRVSNTSTTLVYTLGTWELNGASVNFTCNGTCELDSIRYVVARTSKAF